MMRSFHRHIIAIIAIAFGFIRSYLCVNADTYRLLQPMPTELKNALHPCDAVCLVILDVGETYGTDTYVVEGATRVPTCPKCKSFNVPFDGGKISALIPTLNLKHFSCKVIGGEDIVNVSWNIRKLPLEQGNKSVEQKSPQNRNHSPDIEQIESKLAEINSPPNENVKHKVPGISLRLNCMYSTGKINSFDLGFGQYATGDGKVKEKKNSSKSGRAPNNRSNFILLLASMLLVHAII